MSTPKEKAKELFDKYEKKLMYDYNNYHYKYNLEHCKQCTLIAVDEILKITCLKNLDYKEYFNDNCEFINYWQSVKQEILAL